MRKLLLQQLNNPYVFFTQIFLIVKFVLDYKLSFSKLKKHF